MDYVELVLPEKLSRLLSSQNSTHIFHLNTRSATNKHDSITSFLDQCSVSFDMIMFTETWYQQDADMLLLPDYTQFFLNRKHKRGGGVSIHVKSSIKCELLDIFTETTSDYEILSLKCGGNIRAVMYRPPSADFGIFISFLERFLDYVSANNYSLVLHS